MRSGGKLQTYVYLAIVFCILSFLYILGSDSGLTGFFVFEQDVHTILVNQSFDSNVSLNFNIGSASSFSLSGVISGEGAVKAYLGDRVLGMPFGHVLIFDSSLLNISSNESFSEVCIDSCSLVNISGNVTLDLIIENASLHLLSVEFKAPNQVPEYVKEKKEFIVAENGMIIIDLEGFFIDDDLLTYMATSSEMISVSVDGSLLTIVPAENFTGVSSITLIASDGVRSVRQEVNVSVEKGVSELFEEVNNAPMPVDLEVISSFEFSNESDVIVLMDKKELNLLNKKQADSAFAINSKPDYDYSLKKEYKTINAVALKLTKQGFDKLKKNPAVEAVYYDKVLEVSLEDSLPLINAVNLSGGSGVGVCVLDTGSNLLNVSGYNFVDDNGNISDMHGHGSMVSSIILGVAPSASLEIVKVCDDSGLCKGSDVLAGLDYCVDKVSELNISVISGSFGDKEEWSNTTCPSYFDNVLYLANVNNILSVFASGNEMFRNGINYPACSPYVISVGASTKNDTLADFGNLPVDLLAPGVDINTSFGVLTGTSASVPFVSGAAALIREANAALSPAGIKRTLVENGRLISVYPRLDVSASLNNILEWNETPSPPEDETNETLPDLEISALPTHDTPWAGAHYQTGPTKDASLVSYWQFEKHDNTTNTAIDIMERNNGTLTNSPTWTHDGRIGSAYGFDGVNDYVNISNTLTNYSGIAISLWVKFDTGTYQHLYGPDVSNFRLFWNYSGTLNNFYVVFPNGASFVGGYTGSETVLTDKWYHLVATDNGTQVNLYQDSTNIYSANFGFHTIASAGMNFIFGCRNSLANCFDGSIDEVMVFNRSLSGDEVHEMYLDALPDHINTTITTDQDIAVSSNNTADADADKTKAIYNWYRNGTSIAVLNMPFEGGSLSGNASGVPNATRDYSGNWNNGTVYNATYNATGGIDGKGAYEFDGVGDYIAIGDYTSLNVSKQVTIASWIFPRTLPANSHIIGKTYAYELETYYSTLRFYVKINDTMISYDSNSGTLSAGNLYHVAVTYDGDLQYDNLKMYKNGVLIKKFNASGFINSTIIKEMRIGERNDFTYPYPFNGTIDEVHIFNHSLTPEQIRALYHLEYNRIVEEETSKGQNWSAEVTVNDGSADGTTLRTANITIVNDPPSNSPPWAGAHYQTGPTADASLVSYWQFEKHDNTTNTAIDIMERNNGTLSGPTWTHDGRIGGAFEFDGGNDYIQLAETDSIESPADSDAITVTMWIKPKEITSDTNAEDTLIYTEQIIMRLQGSNDLETYFYDEDGTSNNLNVNDVWTINEWQYLAYTFDNDYVKIYRNGEEKASTNAFTGTGIGKDQVEVLCRIGTYGTEYFNGSIDEVMIFNRSLSSAEVYEMYLDALPDHINTTITTDQDLAVSSNNTADTDADKTKAIYNWFRNGTSITVLNMPFEGGSLSGNASGVPNATRDYSGYWNNGTVYNTTWNATGGHDGRGAYEFDGVDDYVRTANGLTSGLPAITVSVWAKKTDGSTSGYITSSYSDSAGHGVLLRISWDETVDFFVDADSLIVVDSDGTITLDKWHHYIGVYNGSNALLYIDGVLQADQPSVTGNIDDCTADLTIGAGFTGSCDSATYGNGAFNGSIDEVHIFNHSLTAEQIQALYHLEYNRIVEEETSKGQNWSAEITVNDGVNDGITYRTENITIINTIPTQVTPIINTSFGQNITTENITVYNQSFTDNDDEALTRIINWYRNGTSITVLNLPFESDTTGKTGFVINDYSPYQNNGSLGNDVAGKIPLWNSSCSLKGACYEFDGGDTINITNSKDLNITNELTVETWVRPRRSALEVIYAKADSSYYTYGLYKRTDNKFEVRADSGTTAYITTSASTASLNNWQYIAMTVDSSGMKIYYNGLQENISANPTGNLRQTATSFTIGSKFDLLHYQGSIDELRIYNISLTAEQIAANYRAGVPNYDTITPSTTRVDDKWYAKIWANDGEADSNASFTANLTVGGAGLVYGSANLYENITFANDGFTIMDDNVVFNCLNNVLTGPDSSPSTLINATQRTGVTITNCELKSAQVGIFLNHTNNSIVQNNIFGDMVYLDGYDIDLVSVNNATIVNNTIIDNYGLSGILSRGADFNTQLFIYNNSISMDNGVFAFGIYLSRTNGSIVKNNTLYSVLSAGIWLIGTNDCNVTDNSVFDSGSEGISLLRANMTYIQNNKVIRSADRGIEISNSNKNYIINNTVEVADIVMRINSGSNDSLVANNTLRHANINMIKIQDANYTTIQNNTVQNASQGIYLTDGIKTTIHNNRIYDILNKSESTQKDTASGIRIVSYILRLNETTITNNTFLNNYHDIIIWQKANNTLIANNTFQNSSFASILSLHGEQTTIKNNIFLNVGNTSYDTNYFEPRELQGQILTASDVDIFYLQIPAQTRVAAWVEAEAANGTHVGYVRLDVWNSTHSDMTAHRSDSVVGTLTDASFFDTYNADVYNFSVSLGSSIFDLQSGSSSSGTMASNYSLFIAAVPKTAVQLLKEKNSIIENITTNSEMAVWMLNSSWIRVYNITQEGTSKTIQAYNSPNISVQNISLINAEFQNLEYGSINFTNSIHVALQRNLSDVISITENAFYVNSSGSPEFNTTAIITIKNLTSTNPYPLIDLNDDGSYEFCPTTICTKLSYEANNFTFNTTHFTTYSSDELRCGATLLENTNLTRNLNSNGTCFTIGTDSITLDCRNYNITGNGAGALVNATGRNGIIISNCRIDNADVAIYLNNINSSIIQNNIIGLMASSGKGIQTLAAVNITIANNTIGSDTASGVAGIDSTAGYRDIRIYNNSLLYSVFANGIYLRDINDSIIQNNTVQEYTLRGIYVLGTNRVNITGNVLIDDVTDIHVKSSNDTIVKDNKISEGMFYGILLEKAFNSKVLNNTISSLPEGIYAYRGTNNTLIANNTIVHSDEEAVKIVDTNFTTIQNNSFENATKGVYITDGIGTVIHNNRIQNMFNKSQSSFRDTAAGIRITSFGLLFQDTIITNNTFVNNEHAILIWQKTNNTIIANNTFENSSLGAIVSLYGENTKIINNIFKNSGNSSFEANDFIAVEFSNQLSTAGERQNYYVTIPANTKVAAWVESSGNGTHTGNIELDVWDSNRVDMTLHRSDSKIQKWVDASFLKTYGQDTLNFSATLVNTLINIQTGASTTGVTIPSNYSLFIVPIRKSSVQFLRESDSIVENMTTNDNLIIQMINSSWIRIYNITSEGAGQTLKAINSPNISLQNITLVNSEFQNLEYGLINFTNSIHVSLQRNLSDILNITENQFYIKTTTAPEFNTTAVITAKNITDAYPFAFYDPEDDGVFDLCPSDICTYLNFNAANFTFNVTHFTTYKVDTIGGSCTNATTSINLTSDMTAGESCLQVKADNVIIDCQGHNITGNNKGAGINLTGREGVTIKNCNVNAFIEGISTIDSNSNNLTNNTIRDTTNALIFNNTNGYWLNNNTIADSTINLRVINQLNITLYGDSIENPILEHTTHGNINYTTALTFNEQVNLDEAVNFSNEEFFVNSSGYPSLNKSAVLLFKNTKGYQIPRAGVSFNNSKIYSVCHATICTFPSEYNQTLNTISYNVTHFTYYSILEVEEVPPTPAGGTKGIAIVPGGAKGLFAQPVECIVDEDCLEDEKCLNNKCVKMFDIRIIRADSPIRPAEILDFTFLMKAMGEVDGDVLVEYWLQRPDEEEKLVRGQEAVYMSPYQTKLADASLYLYNDMAGKYELVVKISYQDYTVSAIYPIEVMEKAPTILTTELINLTPPKFILKISTNRDYEVPVSIEETITKDNVTVWQTKKKAGVTKHLELEEILTALQPGTYQLKIITEAEGDKNEIITSFTLETPLILEQPARIGIFKGLFLTILYGILILGILAVFFYIGKSAVRDEKFIKNTIKTFRKVRKQRFFKAIKRIPSRRLVFNPAVEAEKILKRVHLKQTFDQARKITLNSLEKAGNLTKDTLSLAKQNSTKLLSTAASLEKKLETKIRILSQTGLDTSILKRKLKKLKTMPRPPVPQAQKKVSIKIKPKGVVAKPKMLISKPIIQPKKTIIQPKIIASEPIFKPITKKIIKQRVSKPAKLVIKKPRLRKIKPKITAIKPKKIVPRIKPAILTKPKFAKEQTAIMEQIAVWKALGINTLNIEKDLGIAGILKKQQSQLISAYIKKNLNMLENKNLTIIRLRKVLEKNLTEIIKSIKNNNIKRAKMELKQFIQKFEAFKESVEKLQSLEQELKSLKGFETEKRRISSQLGEVSAIPKIENQIRSLKNQIKQKEAKLKKKSQTPHSRKFETEEEFYKDLQKVGAEAEKELNQRFKKKLSKLSRNLSLE